VLVFTGVGADSARAYQWQGPGPVGNHIYALTQTVGTWDECQAEAAALGGNLVTINNAVEDEWLVTTFQSEIQSQDFVWIGLYQEPGSPEPDEGWVWISGDPATYRGWAGFEPNNQPPGEDFAVLEQWIPTEWNDWGPGKGDFHPIQGIIELVPEPSTLLLLCMGVVGLLAYAWRRRRR